VLRIGIDVGGTFTDVVGLRDGRELFIAKVPTTPGRLADGILRGVERLLQVSGLSAADVARFTHSTTVATNAILEQRGARVALLATEGFRDVLEIGRQKRNAMYDLFADGQTPAFLAPRRRRVGIRERIDADGSVLVPLDEDQLVEAVDALVRRERIQAVAVSYLFSFLNPVHERRTREVLARRFPELGVSLSSEVDPVFREYERTCVTAFDAYVRPIVATYLRALEDELAGAGIKVELQVMQSRGALTRADLAIERPVSMLLSGPASGVMGGRYAAAQSGIDSVITVDIGGTSCDVALVKEGKPLISREGRIGEYPLRVSMVDVNTIGAGGGSLAWRDESGRLHVGPQSAGADPGPTLRRPTPGWRRWPKTSASPSRCWRRASTGSSTSAWPTRSGWCRSSGGMTRGASPWSRSAAPARSTGAVSPRSCRFPPCSSPRRPACCPRSGSWWPT
jgi:N-methylhydantoinase A